MDNKPDGIIGSYEGINFLRISEKEFLEMCEETEPLFLGDMDYPEILRIGAIATDNEIRVIAFLNPTERGLACEHAIKFDPPMKTTSPIRALSTAWRYAKSMLETELKKRIEEV